MFNYKKLILLICFIIFCNVSFGSPYLYLKIKFNSDKDNDKKVVVMKYDESGRPNELVTYISHQNQDIILDPNTDLPLNGDGEIHIISLPLIPSIEKEKLLGVLVIKKHNVTLSYGFAVNAAKICLIINYDAEEFEITEIHGSGPGPTPPPPPFGECIWR